MSAHATLLPLLQDELRRLLPALRDTAERLRAQRDPGAEAQWQRRIEAFRGAAAVFAGTRFPAFVDWLMRAWSAEGDGDRAQTVQRIDAALALLATLAAAPQEQALAQLNELRVPSAPSTAPPPTPVAPAPAPADQRLRELFAGEVDDKTAGMTRLLVQLEQRPDALELIAPLMRAAHSIKGAARAVRNDSAVRLAHALEDRLSAAQRGERALDRSVVDLALRSVDQLRTLAAGETAAAQQATAELIAALQRPPDPAAPAAAEPAAAPPAAAPQDAAPGYIDSEEADPILRVRASLVGRLIGLASSGMVESRRLASFAQRQQRLRRTITDVGRQVDAYHHHVGAPGPQTPLGAELGNMRQALLDARHELSDWLQQFGEYERDATELTERLYTTAASTRMRPFADVAVHYPRTARDLAHQLDRRVRVEIVGEQIAVDRDVLERLDAPINHLLRNAIDHGIEAPAERRAAGKPEDGRIRIQAAYRAGMLAIDLADDGRGIDFERVRAKLVAGGRVAADAAAALDREALTDFLFSAGFSTREAVSEISGRGVGLDVVRQMIRQLDGSVRVDSTPGVGTTFHLLVPISRAVTRALIVRVAGELYAFPLLRLQRIQRISRDALFDRDGAAYTEINGVNVGLVPLAEQLELGRTQPAADHLDAVVVAREGHTVGFVVDAIVGEFDLASRPLDPRLGRVADIAAVGVLADGSPVVLVDVDDLMRGALDPRRGVVGGFAKSAAVAPRQRVLVVDDSISVRELERQILSSHGYSVDVAVDGMDAWSRLRTSVYDLVVTDVDMPRMDGIELTRSIKQDARLRSVPVVIVSYRDRPEDRARGLEARADAYLTKGDFQEDRLLHTVVELIGPALASP